ncbi:MAG: WXG100 family type VII secretion target [Oscillospiraceae bacterium]|nr:WXG100 family type VII secretion target [Oscillospiraceae bacterium]
MADLILKVTPSQVTDMAGQIKTKKEQMDGVMADMKSIVETLQTYWQSTSGEAFIEKFDIVRLEVSDSLANLYTHIEHLKQVAETYQTLEDQQQQKVNALSAQNIF